MVNPQDVHEGRLESVLRAVHRRGAAPPPRLLGAATAAGWSPTPADHAFLDALARAVETVPAPGVAVLVRRGSRPDGVHDVLVAAYPRARVTEVRIVGGWSRVHVLLSAAGPFDVVVDDTRQGRGRATVFRRTFLQLRPGGTFLVRGYAADSSALAADGEESVARLVARLQEIEPRPDGGRSWADRDEEALAGCVERAVLGRWHLTVTKSGPPSYAKLDEEEVNQLLSLRGPGTGELLARREPLTFRSRCALAESPSERNGEWPTDLEVPAVCLRTYADATCVPGQLVVKGHLLFPDTYRNVQRQRLGNRFTRELTPRFAVPRVPVEPRTALPGTYFYLDDEFRGHFGHALTDQLSRLWAWQEARRAYPGLKALVAVNSDRNRLADFETALFAAAGIGPEDVQLVTGPVQVERLLAATPMLGNPAYVHPGLEAVWADVGARLVQAAPDREYPRRIFCARREQTGPGAFLGARRPCRNAAEVEALFAARGFSIVHPEDHSLPEQARMFHDADVVAGYAGSAMLNLVFSGAPKHVVLVSSEAYVARNEYLISSVLGHRLDVVWCRPDPTPDCVVGTARRNASFHFDPGREGVFLDGVLAALPPDAWPEPPRRPG